MDKEDENMKGTEQLGGSRDGMNGTDCQEDVDGKVASTLRRALGE
jgi:hypothetical protein